MIAHSMDANQNTSAWKWPEIPGIETFEGDLFHTARYKEGYDLKGKRVAVIGAGSSGVQVVASIYNDVERLYTWVRSPTWITAAFGQQFATKEGRNFDCTCVSFVINLPVSDLAHRHTRAERGFRKGPGEVSSVQEND